MRALVSAGALQVRCRCASASSVVTEIHRRSRSRFGYLVLKIFGLSGEGNQISHVFIYEYSANHGGVSPRTYFLLLDFLSS